MNERPNGRESEDFDEDTDELPVLVLEGDNGAAPSDGVTSVTQPEEAIENSTDARASSWVSGMEDEIKELHERWQSLDAELRQSEELNEVLRSQAAEKDNLIGKLQGEVADHVNRIEQLNSHVAEHEAAIADLNAANAEQDAELAEKSTELTSAASRAGVLEDRLQAALKDRDELSRNMGMEQSRLLEISTKRDSIADANKRLSTRVQDLENYIEGRKDKWAALNHELANDKEKITEYESAMGTSEKRLEEQVAEIKSLGQKMIGLERLRSEAEGRHKERENAYQESQARLTEQAAEIERLRVEASDHDNIVRRVSEKADKHKAKLDSLKREIAEKDETIRELEKKIDSGQSVFEHLETSNAEDRKHTNQLQLDIAALAAERDRLTESLADAKGCIQTLEQEIEEGKLRMAELESESADHLAGIAELEVKLAAKDDIIKAFDRNLERLSLLKLDLHKLTDDQAKALGPESRQELTASPAAPGNRDQPRKRAKVAPQLDQRLFVPVDPDGSTQAEYALSKPVMTIGRSARSDIRILDAAVSRLHARLTTEENATLLEDLGSKNGLLVNASPVQRAVLKNGDIISFGKEHEFRYVEVEHSRN